MLKFAYQGQPGTVGPRSDVQSIQSDSTEKASTSTHSHSGEGEDDSCCEVCHHRKRELSREKTRVNRARSRSRDRIRGYVSSSDTSTAFSEESRSRTDTSSEDTSSLGCQHEDRGRKPSRPDLTQCGVGEGRNDNKENEPKSSNGKKGFSLFKMFQKSRMKDKKSSRQCPVCGNEESESCCITNGADLDQEWDHNNKQRSLGKTSPRSSNGKGGNDAYINAWRYNDGSLSACESGSRYKSRQHLSSDESSPPSKSRNRYRNNESDSECLVRNRKMQRTKSGSELCNMERNNNVVSSKGRLMSRSCEKLQAASKVSQEKKEDFGAQFTEVVLREQNGAIDKLQKRYRKKNRRSKSCEKLNITNSPQRQSYRNYDSDWEFRPITVQPTVSSSQSFTSKNRRRAISCERLSCKSFQADDALRQDGYETKRRDLEYKSEVATEPPRNEELPIALVSRAPIMHTVKKATVQKTRTMRSRHSPPDGGATSRKFTTLPRQRISQSDTGIACIKKALPKQCNREYNFNQNGCTDSDITSRGRTLDRRLPERSLHSATQSFHAGNTSQGSNRYNSLPHNATRCFQQNDDVIDYTAQLRQVSSAQREQLFNSSKRRIDPETSSSRGTTTVSDLRQRENLIGYALPEDASVGYPSSSEDSQSLLETSIDNSNNAGPSRHTRYTSLTSLSTTVSTTSEDSMDSGNGSISDRGVCNNPVPSARHRYSPNEIELLRKSATMPRPSRPPVVPQRSLHETSDYESETCSADLNPSQGRGGSPSLSGGQDSSREGSPVMGVYRPPRIRYVDF